VKDEEAIEMMARCRDEIRHLRAINARLAPKAEAWDQLTKVLNLLPQPTQGYAEDLAWALDKRIEVMKAAAASPVPAEG
jgi:hypothetical protein